MRGLSKSRRRNRVGRRLIPWVVALSIVVVACQRDAGGTTTTTTQTPVTTAETTTAPIPLDSLVYRVAILEEFTSSNAWAMLGPDATTADRNLLDWTKPSLFTIAHPGFEAINDLAASADPGVPIVDAGRYAVTISLRQDAVWSDRSRTPITARDVEFTARVVRDFDLGGGWADAYPWVGGTESGVGLIEVTAVDDYTVRFTWDGPPGYAVWPHTVGRAPIMPRHYWEGSVDAAAATEDPAEHLYSVDVINDPSGGPLLVIEWSRSFVRTRANEDFYDRGRRITSGGFDYLLGPFTASQVFRAYSSPGAAFEALWAGHVDFSPVLTSGDYPRSPEGLSATANAGNGFGYVGFDLRNEPMSRQGFRDALAYMVDKEYVAYSVLQGFVQPLYATIPGPDHSWHDPDLAALFAATYTEASASLRHDGDPFIDRDGGTYTATGGEARLHLAVFALKAEGFSWPQGDEPDFRDNGVKAGSDIRLDGRPVEPLVIGAPGPGSDPRIATYALIVAQALLDLGFDVAAHQIESDDPSVIDADNLIDLRLEYLTLDDPALPSHHRVLRGGGRDGDDVGLLDPEFDRLVEAFDAAETREDAYEILWQIETVIFEQKPLIVLYNTVVWDVYRSDSVRYPFTQVLGGLGAGYGYPVLVMPAEG